jgi:chemotaxis protein MotA
VDLATVLGAVVGAAIIMVVMMVSGSLLMYWDFLSLSIVLGGATCATVMRWPLRAFKDGLAVGVTAVISNVEDPQELIDNIVQLAEVARKDSILGLEKIEVQNEFLAKGVRMAVDGTDPELIQQILDDDVEILKENLKNGRGIFEDMADAAPAFGMIGTVIGLIVIMANLTDPSKIGPGLAVALVTTLYGALIANMLFSPLAKKLKYRAGEQIKNCDIIKLGISSMLSGENPRLIRQRLEAFLA